MVGGVAAFFRWSPDPRRPIVITAVALFLVGITVSLVAAAGIESDVALASDIEVLAQGIEFLPEEIIVSGGDVGVWVDNRDGIRHTFSITELEVDLAIPGLKAQRVDFQAEPGEYTIFCTVPGHEAMTAILIVEAMTAAHDAPLTLTAEEASTRQSVRTWLLVSFVLFLLTIGA